MTEPTAQPEIAVPDRIPWHGVLVTEGNQSGDHRSFSNGTMRNRDLPLPLTWQKHMQDKHAGASKVGSIENIYRHPVDDKTSELRSHGYFLQNPEADEVIGEMAHFGKVGVSVDADDITAELDEESESVTFTDSRICSACLVIIPAMAEAWVSLGEPPPGFMGETEAAALDESVQLAISESAWDGSPSRFSDEQYASSCILDRGADITSAKERYGLPIKEPNGDLSRAAVHSAAGRIGSIKGASPAAISAAKSKLRKAYNQLGEDVPENLDAEVETMGRGPGWVTNPVATKRIHDYWTVPGQPGYEKIAWGTEGDFNRCRVEIGQEISEKSPEKLRYINQLCAQWQHDAIGVWPGRGEKLELESGSQMLNLVASATVEQSWVPKRTWFDNPKLTERTPFTMVNHSAGTQVFGHLAEWDACHLDFPGICLRPPRLSENGERFMLGRVLTDDGLVFTGPITLGGGHADIALGLRAAKEHYDDATTAVADVCVGEDDIGIWFAGWLRPNVTQQQKFELLAHQLSGDWREEAGTQKLVAAHVVNTPGFAIKPTFHATDGRQTALVAAGGLRPQIAEVVYLNGGLITGTNSTLTTFSTSPDVSEVVARGIETYEERKDARERIAAAAAAAKATPKDRMELLKGH